MPMSQTLLLIEDDSQLQELLQEYLGTFGFTLHAEGHPEAGLATLASLDPDLVILDVMLPGMNGFEVCRGIRKTSNVPVIMLTARTDLPDRVAGLELGADDYISKPFEPRELVARIQSVLRRTAPAAVKQRAVRFGPLVIDHDARTATLDGQDTGLTTGEFNALAALTAAPGTVLDRDALLQALRGLDADIFNRSVDITMSRLRNKLHDDPNAPRFIKTVWGAGYVFIGRESDDA